MLRVVSDVHGLQSSFLDIISGAEYSLQLGDMGYNYDSLNGLSLNNRWFPGNHDLYPGCFDQPNCIGNYGPVTLGGVDFWFLRGAFSIDKEFRIKMYWAGKWPQTWFADEELHILELEKALNNYSALCPQIVFTHDCPRSLVKYVGSEKMLRDFGFNPETFTTRTQEALQECFEIHKPKLWIFGHFHKSFDMEIDGTRFICMPELGYVDVSPNGDVVYPNPLLNE